MPRGPAIGFAFDEQRPTRALDVSIPIEAIEHRLRSSAPLEPLGSSQREAIANYVLVPGGITVGNSHGVRVVIRRVLHTECAEEFLGELLGGGKVGECEARRF